MRETYRDRQYAFVYRLSQTGTQREPNTERRKRKRETKGSPFFSLSSLVLKVKFLKRRVPKGTSDYQAGWILDADDVDGEFPDEGDDDEEGEGTGEKERKR